MQLNLEEEAQRLLNNITVVSSDIHKMPRDNLNHMEETLDVSILLYSALFFFKSSLEMINFIKLINTFLFKFIL